MKFYVETTDYKDSIKNGTYLLSDDKSRMFAYIKPGSNGVFKFKNPIRIDTRGRTFKPVPNTFNYEIKDNSNPKWTVVGSKGNVYTVEQTENGLTCSCSGFRYRGNCKHLSVAKNK